MAGRIREGVTASPLSWPAGWKRRTHRQRARFGDTNAFRETQEILHQLDMLGVHSSRAIVSTDLRLRLDGIPYAGQGAPKDPGAAVWFVLRGEERVLACDAWDRVEHNLRAIAKHIEALRGQARWGVGSVEQSFRGFAALPETAGAARPWWEVLGVYRGAPRTEIERAYRAAAMRCHPDHGGTREAWDELAEARRQALQGCA